MNRKKIALLLTGLVVTSGILTSCGTNNKTADNSSTVKQEALRRATDRQVTPYDEKNNYEGINSYQNIGNYQGTDGYPNVAYAEDIMDNSIINKFNESNFDNSSVDNQMNLSKSYDGQINFDEVKNRTIDSTMTEENNLVNYMDPTIGENKFDRDLTQIEKQNNMDLNPTTNGTTVIPNAMPETSTFDSIQNGQVSNISPQQEMAETSAYERTTEPKAATEIDQNQVVGQIKVVRTVGSSEIVPAYNNGGTLEKLLNENNKENPDELDKKKQVNTLVPQGIAEVSFTLSGEVLGITGNMAKQLSSSNPDHITPIRKEMGDIPLSTLIQNAYEETLRDANTGFNGTVELTHRENLRDTLMEMFKATRGINLTFKSNKGDITLIPFWAADFIPGPTTSGEQSNKWSGLDYVRYRNNPHAEIWKNYARHIIDLEAINMGLNRNVGIARSVDASTIPIKFVVRQNLPLGSNLETDTTYTYVGTQNGEPIRVAGLQGKTILTGFNMGTFTTGKVSAKIDTKTKIYDVSSGQLKDEDIIFITTGKPKQKANDKGVNVDNKIATDLYVSNISDGTYIDMQVLTSKSNLDSTGEENSTKPEGNKGLFEKPIERTGTSIKFRPLVFNDTNNTITKIEFEDDRGQLYKGQLVSEDSSKENGAKYLEVTGLERSMPYVFQKLHITSKLGDKEERKTIYFAAPKDSTNTGTITQLNNIPIRTSQFHGPKLSLFAPAKDMATLPGNLTIKSVKNDRTALRYVLKTDNTEGTLGKINVNGLKPGEQARIEKFLDSNGKVSYYTLTLSNLTPGADYGFLILELEYKDPQGNEGVTRQALGDINVPSQDKTVDNTTETTALTGNDEFQVIVEQKMTSKDPRKAEVPVFVDDIKSKFAGIEFSAPTDAPDAKAVYENGKIIFTGLKPNSTVVCKVDFLSGPEGSSTSGDIITGSESVSGGNGSNTGGGNVTDIPTTQSRATASESVTRIPRYITITTPQVQDLDIKSATPTITGIGVDFKFEFYSEPKSPIKTVVVKDNANKEIKSTWDKTTNTLKLDGLKEETEYTGVQVTFTLENNKTIVYTLDKFITKLEVVKPTGKVAEFVQRVYKIALGREPEVEGWNFWINKLEKKEITATEFIAENLMTQKEFVERQLPKAEFVTTMYSLIVNREPDADGQKYWERKYDEYKSQTNSIAELRIKIAREMMDQPEFKELVTNLRLKY